jgi:hypothetical protein
MKELIKEFNKFLYAEHGVTLDCNYNKDEMYLIYWFIRTTLMISYDNMSNYCNIELINHLLETINLGKPETVFQQMEYVQLHGMEEK